jgi:hypothetical protein
MALHSDAVVADPSVMGSLSKAVDEACEALHIPPRDREARKVVAARIIDLMRDGLTDPETLRDRVIAEAKMSL